MPNTNANQNSQLAKEKFILKRVKNTVMKTHVMQNIVNASVLLCLTWFLSTRAPVDQEVLPGR